MQYFEYIANDNARREREIQLAARYDQKPVNTFRKPPKLKRPFHIIEVIVVIGIIACIYLFLTA